LEPGFTTQVMNPLLNPQIARLKGSMGSLNSVGRTMESPATLAPIACVGSFVTVGVIGCAGEDSVMRQAKAARNDSLIRNPGIIFKRIIHIEAFFMILSFFSFHV
jgi:hypothetical protein